MWAQPNAGKCHANQPSFECTFQIHSPPIPLAAMPFYLLYYNLQVFFLSFLDLLSCISIFSLVVRYTVIIISARRYFLTLCWVGSVPITFVFNIICGILFVRRYFKIWNTFLSPMIMSYFCFLDYGIFYFLRRYRYFSIFAFFWVLVFFVYLLPRFDIFWYFFPKF